MARWLRWRLRASAAVCALVACDTDPPAVDRGAVQSPTPAPEAALVAGPGTPPAYLSLPLEARAPGGGDIAPGDRGHYVWASVSEHAPPRAPAEPAPTAPASVATPPVAGSDVNVSAAADSYQGETTAASNGATLVAASNWLYPGACAKSGTTRSCSVRAYASSDGLAWSTIPIGRTWKGATFGLTFDPVVDTDTAGRFYLVIGGAPLSGSYPNSVAVARGSADGLVWSAPVAVTFNTKKTFDDKYWLAVDRTAGAFRDRIYVAWTRNSSRNQTLMLSWSGDLGATWRAPLKVNDGTSMLERVIDAGLAVDQTAAATGGRVYLIWHDYARGKLMVDSSSSGGLTWGADVAVTGLSTGFGTDLGCVGGRAQGPAPSLAVGASGTLHLVYANAVAGRGFDIRYQRSVDAAQTWSAPVTLNDDGGASHQFQPMLAVAAGASAGGDDVVTVAFYDRRDDAANCLSHVFAVCSDDGGLSWSSNVRVTSEASNFDGNSNGPGDYSSAAAHGVLAHPFFADHRTSNAETAAGGAFDIYTVPLTGP